MGSFLPDAVSHAFLWQDGKLHDLNALISSRRRLGVIQRLWHQYFGTDRGAWFQGSVSADAPGEHPAGSWRQYRPGFRIHCPCPITNGATAQLIVDGHPEATISGLNPQVVDDENFKTRVMRVTFNLTGAAPGTRTVVISQPDGSVITLNKAFQFELGELPQISLDIVGRDVVRVGQSITYEIVVHNQGNVDALGVPIWVAGLPEQAGIEWDFPVNSPAPLSGLPAP